MDEIVKAALKKWPDVPHCYGWLALDARGDWYMRDEPSRRAGPFPQRQGQPHRARQAARPSSSATTRPTTPALVLPERPAAGVRAAGSRALGVARAWPRRRRCAGDQPHRPRRRGAQLLAGRARPHVPGHRHRLRHRAQPGHARRGAGHRAGCGSRSRWTPPKRRRASATSATGPRLRGRRGREKAARGRLIGGRGGQPTSTRQRPARRPRLRAPGLVELAAALVGHEDHGAADLVVRIRRRPARPSRSCP